MIEKLPAFLHLLPGVLSWPFRIIMYVMMYIAWAMVSLLVLAFFPAMTYLQAVNVLPVGWVTIAAVFFVDLYVTQLNPQRKRRPQG